MQLIAPAIAKSIADGSLFAYDSGGTALTGSTVVFYAVSIAPFFLIYLALVRGRRVGRRSLVVFPILGTVVVLVGGLPFIATNFANATFARARSAFHGTLPLDLTFTNEFAASD